jgi:1,4-alpha-glucan branching enzyme
MTKGYLALVLHLHLPYVRHPEYDHALEEHWFFEAITETYLPLLLLLDDLAWDDIDFRLTLSITPTLAAMLGDPFLQYRYTNRLGHLIELAAREILRTRASVFYDLALFYHQRLCKLRDAYLNRYARNLLQAFKRHQDMGRVEIIASAATHGYLPLLAAIPAAVRAQVEIGVQEYQRLFNTSPRGFWLPECGFTPGIDEYLADQAIRYTILETHGLTRAEPRPANGTYAPVSCPSGVAAFGRDPESSRQVWSSVEGYPGDYDYREFYRDIAYELDREYLSPCIHPEGFRLDTGIKYFRITGKTERKEIYVPARAERKAEVHAENFIVSRARQIERLAELMDRKPLVVAPYDAELFGHWWYEGPVWLNFLFRKLSTQQTTVRLVTLSEYLEEYPVNQVSSPSASSWGQRGTHETWLNDRNDWIYPHLHQGAQKMARLAHRHAPAAGMTLRAMRQAERELLLAQASDWAFMLHANKMGEYAALRTKAHLAQFLRLQEAIENRQIDERWLTMIECRNNIFPQIDINAFHC